ncbi:hypothetical protein ACLOJK_000512 [Asimina triloba]
MLSTAGSMAASLQRLIEAVTTPYSTYTARLLDLPTRKTDFSFALAFYGQLAGLDDRDWRHATPLAPARKGIFVILALGLNFQMKMPGTL